jgi:hypothetical protein
MRIRENKGKITSRESKHKLASLANISVTDTNQLPLAEIVQRLRDARAQLQILQSQHYELLEDHLNQLAEARVNWARQLPRKFVGFSEWRGASETIE